MSADARFPTDQPSPADEKPAPDRPEREPLGSGDQASDTPEIEAFLADKRTEIETLVGFDALVERPEVREAMDAAWDRSNADD
jgi:hypothetical protein